MKHFLEQSEYPSGIYLRLPKVRDKEASDMIVKASNSVVDLSKEALKRDIDVLATRSGIGPELSDEFRRAAEALVRVFKRRHAAAVLPEGPVRDYSAGEGILTYLRSEDGFGPWIQAGALTRPLIREKAPRAYMALANWLRTNDLPYDLEIPTLSEVLDDVVAILGEDARYAVSQSISPKVRRERCP